MALKTSGLGLVLPGLGLGLDTVGLVNITRFPRVFTVRRVCIAQTMPSQDVHLSVRLSHAGILSKRLYIRSYGYGISSKFFQHRVAPAF